MTLSTDILAEVRGWLTLIVLIIGGFISLRTYQRNQRQRELENSFRLITMFKESLYEGDIKEWKNIFHGTSEPAGAEEGFFVDIIDGKRIQCPLSDLFSEGSPDNGAIERMAELFDLISSEILNGNVEVRLIYFQLGQLMDTTHCWSKLINNPYEEGTFLQENYPSFDHLYKKGLLNQRWAKRTYTHIS